MNTKVRVSDDGTILSVSMQDKIDPADLISSNVSESEAIQRFFRENDIPVLHYQIPLNQPVKTEFEKRSILNKASRPVRLLVTLTKREQIESDDELSS